MRYVISLLLIFTLISCKKDAHSHSEITTNKDSEVSFIEQIALANGFEHWSKVEELKFSFNVLNNGKEFQRDWRWLVQEEKAFMELDGEEVGIDIFQNPDQQIHQAFINDTYWLLFPFQLLWTDGYDFEVKEKTVSPFHEKELTELSVQFKENGGYTPGDKYQVYINEDLLIEEWSFFPAGSDEPRLINAWENYQTFKDIKISTDRRNLDGSFRIFFTDIAIK